MSDEDSFADAIKNKIASKRDREEEEKAADVARKKQYQEACAKAMQVRDEVIIPLLRKMKSDCENQKLIRWLDVQSDGNIGSFSGKLESREVRPAPQVVIRGEVTAGENGERLLLSVKGDYTNPMNTSANKSNELHPPENTNDGERKGDKSNFLSYPLEDFGGERIWLKLGSELLFRHLSHVA